MRTEMTKAEMKRAMEIASIEALQKMIANMEINKDYSLKELSAFTDGFLSENSIFNYINNYFKAQSYNWAGTKSVLKILNPFLFFKISQKQKIVTYVNVSNPDDIITIKKKYTVVKLLQK